jgi:hypothetical protein
MTPPRLRRDVDATLSLSLYVLSTLFYVDAVLYYILYQKHGVKGSVGFMGTLNCFV